MVADEWMDGPMDGWTNGWTMFLSHTDVIDASENDDFPTDFAIFTKAQWTNPQTDQLPTDEPTDSRI